ncbi:aminotransferase class V-fold PLP-dependent enzyme [Pyxidicoccus fallax]|nr:aminotransferase class V-fold PLP-dependent enzyme [Pyxidicoccus fallax]
MPSLPGVPRSQRCVTSRERELSSLDPERIRGDFPMLQRMMKGRPLVYLDSAATSQKPRVMIDQLSRLYAGEYAKVEEGHSLSQHATEVFEEVRAKVARLITCAEHASNIIPWQLACEDSGATLRVVPITKSGALEPGSFEKLLTERTRIVAVSHVSNVTGTIYPVKEITRMAHARGIPVLVDGAQAVPHLGLAGREAHAGGTGDGHRRACVVHVLQHAPGGGCPGGRGGGAGAAALKRHHRHRGFGAQ